jgi:hypothetical protein
VDARSQVWHVEVEQEAERMPTQSKIREELCAMNRQHNLNAFQFDDQASFDNEVDSVGALQSDAAIDNWQADLVFKTQASVGQFVVEARIARTFEDAAPSALCTLIAALITIRLTSFGFMRNFRY